MPNPHAARQRHLDECRRRAIVMMDSARGQEAKDGMYYTELFNYLCDQFKAGKTPTGIPAKLLEELKAIGEYRRERGKGRGAK